MANDTATTVYYDGACPLCRREIAFYRQRRGAEALRWVDVSACDGDDVAPGLSKQAALARFHVRTTDGELVDGARAFAALWSQLPTFRPVGSLLARPPFLWAAMLGYAVFLRVRPWLQRRAGGAAECSETCARTTPPADAPDKAR